ncbi:MAG: hypothetical protein NW201_03455 [Gemmatimonadales bacterium]|nr:hypothetical protein [Gemmatimonadales bacterium]
MTPKRPQHPPAPRWAAYLLRVALFAAALVALAYALGVDASIGAVPTPP